MKETYVKPTTYMESFALAQTIAISCHVYNDTSFGRANHLSPDVCEWMMGDLALFDAHCGTEGGYDMSEFGEFEGICYNNPEGGTQVFSSM